MESLPFMEGNIQMTIKDTIHDEMISAWNNGDPADPLDRVRRKR